MKHLPVVILLMVAALVAVVTGCRGSRLHDDARLVAADSLLTTAPDSALALVEALTPDSLTTEGDRAYRDLLVTQARYKCYITATSDSDINRALDYYRAHDDEREKLTRAYIYKGAVMEELGHPDSAMLYYKHAEATAAPDDYFNLGYVKMRIGSLYRDNYAMDGIHIKRFEDALDYLKQAGDTNYILRCMVNLGALYRLKKPTLSENILQEARDISRTSKDTSNYIHSTVDLLQTYYVQQKYPEALALIHELLTLQNKRLDFSFYANAADTYARLGLPDSAVMMINMTNQSERENVFNEMMYLESLGEIALARGDSTTYKWMDGKCKYMEDSLLALETPINIVKIEELQDKNFQQFKAAHEHAIFFRAIIITVALIAFVLLYVIYQYNKRNRRIDNIIKELRETSASQLNELSQMEQRIKQLNIQDAKLKEFFDSHTSLIRELVEECYHAPNSKLHSKLKEIIQYQGQNKSKWFRLQDYINTRYNNILSDAQKKCPKLNDRDLLLLTLSTLDFSCVQIALIMGYSNATSVGPIRQRLAQKLGLEGNLMQYIDEYR